MGLDEVEGLNIVIGPYYSNLAMILEQNEIPYLVTDYRGYDWTDRSRVNDHIQWGSMVEIRPPVQEQNRAVVDLFLDRGWGSAVMIMPENPKDNQECQDLARQMIENRISLIPYSIEPTSPNSINQTDSVIRSSDIRGQKNIIICSPRDDTDNMTLQVLLEAKKFNILSRTDYHFIIVELNSYLRPLAGVNMYKSGLFATRSRIYAFRYDTPDPDGGISKTKYDATATDSALITKVALRAYMMQHNGTNSPVLKASEFLKALRQVRLDGKTGHIQFNKTGQRVNYTLSLYHHGGENMYTHYADWVQARTGKKRFKFIGGAKKKRSKKYGIFPKVVKVVVVLEKPFIMLRMAPRGTVYEGNDRFEGFTVDLLHKLSELLSFKYEIYVSPKNSYGILSDIGEWDGMIREILDGNATLSMGAISITSQREKVVDFSLGIITTGITMLVLKPEESMSIFQFMKPFSIALWMAIVGSTVVTSLVYFLLDYRLSDVGRKFTMRETLWFTVGTLMMRGTDFSPKPMSQRILTGGFLFFVLITISTYTANMAAFLTTMNIEKSVGSFEDLADSSLDCGTIENSATMDFFKKGEDRVYKQIWHKMLAGRGLVPNSTEGVRRVEQGGYAFIFDFLINDYAEGHNCTTVTVGEPMILQEHGIGMIQGAPYKTKINIATLNLKEENYIQMLKKRWWDDKRQCGSRETGRSGKDNFGLKHTAGVFIVGLGGLIVSSIFFLFKKFYIHATTDKEKDTELKKQNSTLNDENCYNKND